MKNAILICFCAAQLCAQKSAQVEQYLGRNYEQIAPAGTIAFRFEKITLTRNADGAKTYQDLLTHSTGYDDTGGGELASISIVKDGKVSLINRSPKVVQAASEVMPIPGKGFSMQDSATTAETINGLKQKISASGKEVWGRSAQWWDFLLWLFDSAFYTLLCLGGLFRFGAKASVNEHRMNAWGGTIYGGWVQAFGAFASAGSFLIVFSVLLVILTNVFIRTIAGNLSGLFAMIFSLKMAGVVAWFGLLELALRFTDWFVPNPKVIGRGGDNNQTRIPGRF